MRPDTRPVGPCSWCQRPARLTATERGRICPGCVDVYLLEAQQERQAVIYGEAHRRTPVDQLPVTPRSRGHVETSWAKMNERVAIAAAQRGRDT
jgi:hypothetical protein